MRTSFMIKTFTFLCFAFLPFYATSQVKITLDNPKAHYAVGEKAVFRISSNAFGKGTYEIYYDTHDPLSLIKKGV